MFDQIIINLGRARDTYVSSLRSIDGELRKIVSQDPTQLAAAQAIQDSYTDEIAGCALAASEQPTAQPSDTTVPAKAAKKAAKKAKKAK